MPNIFYQMSNLSMSKEFDDFTKKLNWKFVNQINYLFMYANKIKFKHFCIID